MPTRLTLAVLTVFTCLNFPAAHAQVAVDCSAEAARAAGTWQWVETFEIWGGILTTPESLGQTETVVLYADGSADILVDDSLLQQTTWEVEDVFDLGSPDPVGCRMVINTFTPGMSAPYGILTLDDDEMIVDNTGQDGVRITFVRADTPVSSPPTTWGGVKAVFDAR
jgi:hypothetical protein